MNLLSEHDIFLFILQLGIIILSARLCGLAAQRLGQPIIVGEVLAGVLLGPSMFGALLPRVREWVFPAAGNHVYLLQGTSWLCVVFLLLITGLEIDLRASLRRAKKSVLSAFFALAVPFTGIYILGAFLLPKAFIPPDADPVQVRLLLATALSVVSIDTVAKILFDLKILRSFVGLNIITSGILSDLLGWVILASVLSLVHNDGFVWSSLIRPVVFFGVYLSVALTVGRWLVDRLLDWIGVKEKDQSSVLAVLFGVALLNGAVAHLLGLHVIFGAFVAGLMAGESKKITPHMREAIQDHVFGVFAPIFFVLVGMQIDFRQIERGWILLAFLGAASILKIIGGAAGALLGGLGRRNALALGCGVNTQGTIGIIVALIGLEAGLFTEDLFTMVVVICIASALSVGPLLIWSLKGVRRPLAAYFDPHHVFLDLPGGGKEAVVRRMVEWMAERGIIDDVETTRRAIWDREETMSTAIGDGVALPHARLANLKKPILCFFRTKDPVPFDSPDDRPVQLFFLELTDNNDDGMQLNLISQVARFVASPRNRDRLLAAVQEEDIHHILSMDEKI